MDQFKQQFTNKLNKLIDFVETNQEKSKVTENLVSSFYMNFGRIMASDQNMSSYLNDFSSAPDANSSKLFDYLDSKNVDYQYHLKQAQEETFNAFVTELEKSLPSEKVEELRKIIAE